MSLEAALKILVADDDPVTLRYLTAGLEHHGFTVVGAVDAMQAVMKAIQGLPDAVVLDIKMPGGTGVTALKRIKQSTKSQHIPVIAITGSPRPEVRAEVLGLGAVDCLEKPVDVEALAAMLTGLGEESGDA
jgi:CheY-like chemotaxis protein